VFSIVIVTWKNYGCLKMTVDSIKKNSFFDNEIVVHVQEDCSLSKKYLEDLGIAYTFSDNNIGLSSAANLASSLATKEILCFFDDDMYALPLWDRSLLSMKKRLPLKSTACSIMIENNGVIDIDCGKTLASFDEDKLLSVFSAGLPLVEGRYNNSSCPFLVDRDSYFEAGGYDEDLPNVGAELGLAKNLWDIGFRDIGVECVGSLVYHLQSTTLNRLNRIELAKNRDTVFMKKHNHSSDEFRIMMKKGKSHQWNKIEK